MKQLGLLGTLIATLLLIACGQPQQAEVLVPKAQYRTEVYDNGVKVKEYTSVDAPSIYSRSIELKEVGSPNEVIVLGGLVIITPIN